MDDKRRQCARSRKKRRDLWRPRMASRLKVLQVRKAGERATYLSDICGMASGLTSPQLDDRNCPENVLSKVMAIAFP